MQAYNKIDQQIHQLAQTIAKFNRTYVPKLADDSHTNLAFDPLAMRLVGRWVDTPNGKLIMALNLFEFTYELLDRSWKSVHSFPIAGKTQAQTEQVISDYIPELGLKAEGFTDKLHFEITAYDFAQETFSEWQKNDIQLWANGRSLGNDACQWLLNHLQIEGEVRIWPHHFDTGIYVESTSKVGLGFGLAMQDNMIRNPYFYYSAYGLNDHEIDLTKTKALTQGKWIVEDHWKGAVLEMSMANRQNLFTFLKEVTTFYLASA